MKRRLKEFLTAIGLAAALALSPSVPAWAASPGHPSLAICNFDSNGQCVGGAGWQFQGNNGVDQCGAPYLWSQNYGYSVSVWIDDSLSNRAALDGCEQSIGRPAYHVFYGIYGSENGLWYGEGMYEWYPFHWTATISPAKGYGWCPGNGYGFITQQNFAWSGDYPPSNSESGAEWGDAIGCIPSGQVRFMGTY